MKFFDSYAHLGLVSSDAITLLRIVQEAKRAGVTHIINVSNSVPEFAKVYTMVEDFQSVFHAAGFAPSEANTLPLHWQQQLEDAAAQKNVVAIGAVGLDYSHGTAHKNAQIELFIKQLNMAQKLHKPVLVYNRNAGDDIKSILKAHAPDTGVIFHCYSETAEYARTVLKEFSIPVYFSFAGNITFRNSHELHQAVLNIPLDNILVETASPFLPPTPFTGMQNVPAHIFATVEFISEILDMDFETCAEKIYRNSLKAFRFSKAEHS